MLCNLNSAGHSVSFHFFRLLEFEFSYIFFFFDMDYKVIYQDNTRVYE